MTKIMSSVMAALMAHAVVAEEAKSADKNAATNAPLDFAVVCSNAWIKGATAKSSVGYKTGDDIRFSLSLMGVTNAIPAGKYFYKWKRTGDDGVVEEGKGELSEKPFAYTTKSAKPGFVRFSAELITADGKPFKRKTGKSEQPLFFNGGAGVSVEELLPPSETQPREFDAMVKELRRKVSAVPFKKIERTAVAAPALRGVKVFSVSVPTVGARPVTGYLCLPDEAVKGGRLPCRLTFIGCGFAKAQPLPNTRDVPLDAVSFVVAYDESKEAVAAEGYHSGLFCRLVRALQYLKSIPEWDGRNLVVHNGGGASYLSVWAAACGEGVTKARCVNVRLPEIPQLDPLFFARRIPSTCLMEVIRVGLGDDQYPPRQAAVLWNALTCERKITWAQGWQAWTGQPGFKDRDVLWEKLSAVRFHDMDAEHCKPIGTTNPAFKDLDMALRDKIVVEAIVDPSDTKLLNPVRLTEMKTYADRAKVPLTVYMVIPEKKVKDKVWTDFVKVLTANGHGFPYPIYLNAGIDLPKPEKLPWYNILDHEGVLRYSGPEIDKASAAYTQARGRLPKADPVFAYAVPKLFKTEIEKAAKAKRTGHKLLKYIEAEHRKYIRSDPAKFAEGEHLLLGMRQACDSRLQDILIESRERPGRAWLRLNEFLADWPGRASDSRVASIQGSVKTNPEIEKISKLEAELVHLRAWKPLKPSEIKKRDVAVAAFRKKLEKYANGKDTALQGEALLIQAEFDNPPPEASAQ